MKNKIPHSETTPEFQQSIDGMSNEGKNNVDNTLKTINIMEKTAMQELIEWVEKFQPYGLSRQDVINKAKLLLPKERQQMEKAWDAGFDRGTYEACDIDELVVPKEKDDYFTQTYQK